ncbi:heavy metal translocating P-type ATPase [Streptomyces sodiiphilus]|uniref:Heavy metal translocating P-type ATPase n=1 Tax=Streptomyces sodiiphilus TaxID=226217 RepID=A0ABN2NY78_9ACTN
MTLTPLDRESGSPAAPAPGPLPRRTPLLRLPEARWAAAALAALLTGLVLDLAGAPPATWWSCYAVCYAAGGWQPARDGLAALREKSLDVDLLMVAAALGAAAIGQPLEGALLIVIFATSGALEAYATQRTADSVRGLLDLAPQSATRLRPGGGEETVPAVVLAPGDVVLVRPGERIGADGIVTEGSTEVQQASITGEPLPVPRATGDEVFAGSLNGTGALRVRVSRAARESVIARIAALVEEASEAKAPRQLFIERIEQRYAVGMVAATLAVFTVPLALGADLSSALLRAMTFMIVASPCAVVLATMPPLLAAIANAGRHGVLIKSAAVMERLGTVDRVVFDKTGTLTEGTPRLEEIRPLPDGPARERLLALAAAAEQASEHPLGRAVREAAEDLPPAVATGFRSAPGHGVSALVGGVLVEVTRPGRQPAAEAAGAVAELEEAGLTTAVVSLDGTPAGVLGFSDRLRPEAPDSVRRLTALTGSAPVLLTGDHARAAAGIASRTGITEVRAALLPHEKAETVADLERRGHRVLAVGDGVNDAPALAAAHTGLAMGRGGADLTLETADAVLVRNRLDAVPAVVELSRRARRLVTQNLVIAGGAIIVLVTWDLVGHLPLPLGVAGHEGSTVLVALNGLRLLRRSAWPEHGPDRVGN